MQMMLNEAMAVHAAASPPKSNNQRKTGDDDKSFQDSLDEKVRINRDQKKSADEQEKAATTNAANAAQANAQTSAKDKTEVDQSQAAAEVNTVMAQSDIQLSNALQQAVEALSQDAQQTDLQVENPLFNLNPQTVEADPSQTTAMQMDIKVDLKSDAQASLQMLDQQEVGNKAMTDLNMVKVAAGTQSQKLDDAQGESENLDTFGARLNNEMNSVAVQGQTAQVMTYAQLQQVEKQNNEAQSALVLNQINDQIKTSLESGKDVLKIQLQPENLGKVDVRIVRGNDGMQFFFTADTISTSRMLQNSLNQLHQSLVDAGVKVGNMSVSYQGQQGQQNSGQFQQRKNGFSFMGQNEPDLAVEFQSRNALSALDTII